MGYTRTTNFAPRFPPSRAKASLWLSVLAFLLVGCATPTVHPVEHLVGPGLDEPLPRSSQATWPADPRRLRDDVLRAVKRNHWAILQITPSEAAAATQPAAAVVRAQALLPDGRSATIVAWPADRQRVSVAVRVGHFGDPAEERSYIATVARALVDKPQPQRGGKFVLPE